MPPIDAIENPQPTHPTAPRGGFLQVVVSKATAADSDEATNFSSAVASDTTLGLTARNDFRVARDLGVVERMLPSQVRAAIFTVGLPRPRCTEDTGSGC